VRPREHLPVDSSSFAQTAAAPKHYLHIQSIFYDWFTEGFDTPDLKEVKALLDELGGS
jgi:hypothetical protein